MQKKLVVYLLSYKRPDYIVEAINSILAQQYSSFDLIISENSPNQDVINALEIYRNEPRLKIVKRTPSLASLDHFNLILQELTEKYEYAMLFHDDDVLLPQALETMMAQLENNPEASAVSCNAYFLKNAEVSGLFNNKLNKVRYIRTAAELISGYIIKSRGHTAFPTYIYRVKHLENLKLDSRDGGKYSDVSFLVKLVSRAYFIWVPEPLVKYRLHQANDSAQLNLKNIFSLSLFFIKKSPQSLPLVAFYLTKQIVKKILYFFK